MYNDECHSDCCHDILDEDTWQPKWYDDYGNPISICRNLPEIKPYLLACKKQSNIMLIICVIIGAIVLFGLFLGCLAFKHK